MKSETVVDVESVDSDLLYLLLQHIYSQNSGAVFRVSFVFFFVKREEETFQVKPILVLSPRIFLFDNLIISWRALYAKVWHLLFWL